MTIVLLLAATIAVAFLDEMWRRASVGRRVNGGMRRPEVTNASQMSPSQQELEIEARLQSNAERRRALQIDPCANQYTAARRRYRCARSEPSNQTCSGFNRRPGLRGHRRTARNGYVPPLRKPLELSTAAPSFLDEPTIRFLHDDARVRRELYDGSHVVRWTSRFREGTSSAIRDMRPCAPWSQIDLLGPLVREKGRRWRVGHLIETLDYARSLGGGTAVLEESEVFAAYFRSVGCIKVQEQSGP